MPVISTNTAANTAVRFLNVNASDQSNSLAKLASGSNINKASDDAAGLAIATKISSDVAALEQASTNASHGISVLQTADGGASNIGDILERMKVLASQSASGTVTDTERTYIQAEFEELQEEIDGITQSTRYNGQSLLDGSSDFAADYTSTATVAGATAAATVVDGDSGTISINGVDVTIDNSGDTSYTVDEMVADINAATASTGVTASNESGTLTLTATGTNTSASIELADVSGTLDLSTLGLTAGTTDGTVTENSGHGADIVVGSDVSDTINLSIASLTTSALGIDTLDISSQTGAETALSALDTAIDSVSNARAELGATMSRFEFRSAQIDTSVENLEAAESAISDVDIAKEQAELSSASVKVQAAVAAASQANEMPENLLSLIR